jgi:hypothetical protein
MSAPAPSKPTSSEPEQLRTLWQRMHGKGLLLRDDSRPGHVSARERVEIQPLRNDGKKS